MKIALPNIQLPVGMSRFLYRNKLKLQANSPKILLALGLLGGAGTVVVACKATTQLPDVVASHEALVASVRKLQAASRENTPVEKVNPDGSVTEALITPEEARKELAKVRVKMALDYIHLYTPALMLGGASTACIIGSYHKEHGRYLGAMTLYEGALSDFNKYRERVRNDAGEETDLKYYQGYDSAINDVVTTDEKGKKKHTKEESLIRVDTGEPSQYVRYFDSTNKYWERDPSLRMLFLKCQQEYFQRLLERRGYVFLNEVYDALGFEMTSAGAMVGWVLGPANAPTNYISFGIDKADNPAVRAFINGSADFIPLDFNVNGVIIDMLEEV